ncbi:hypothetical protein J2853_004849 [Streptosporangium lutulentum]|uniref:Uncharacterized protein n=1 Tax=Streptosporangium lutulentum TaxID=1461250 RepID=A0ABT9QFU7_9ACTN|nr:hypothetical protein [Streptosporangium lutulentum]
MFELFLEVEEGFTSSPLTTARTLDGAGAR